MQKKYTSGLLVIAIVAIAGILIASRKPRIENSASCKSADKPCLPAAKPVAPASTLEHLSHQFISIPVIFH